jgi:hypothetical protein
MMKQRVTLRGGIKALVLVTGAVFAATMLLAAALDPGGLSPSLVAGNLFSAVAIAASALGCLAVLRLLDGAFRRLDAPPALPRRDSSPDSPAYPTDSLWND